MTKVKKNEGYDIYEHVHRFAAWAAARAASQKGHRFSVSIGKKIIDNVELRDKIGPITHIASNAENMDIWHKGMCERIREEAKKYITKKGKKIEISHGVAAKLINVYLKVALVTVSSTDKNIGLLHPPIDSQVLKGLKKDEKGKNQKLYEFWKIKCKRGWSKFTCEEYQAVIKKIRQNPDFEKQLWMVEKYFQDSTEYHESRS